MRFYFQGEAVGSTTLTKLPLYGTARLSAFFSAFGGVVGIKITIATQKAGFRFTRGK
jgi:hypothetical protein